MFSPPTHNQIKTDSSGPRINYSAQTFISSLQWIPTWLRTQWSITLFWQRRVHIVGWYSQTSFSVTLDASVACKVPWLSIYSSDHLYTLHRWLLQTMHLEHYHVHQEKETLFPSPTSIYICPRLVSHFEPIFFSPQISPMNWSGKS